MVKHHREHVAPSVQNPGEMSERALLKTSPFWNRLSCGLGLTPSAPQPTNTPEWTLLKTNVIFNSWSCGLRLDDAATGLVPAALIAISCGADKDYFKIMTDFREAMVSSTVVGRNVGVTAADLFFFFFFTGDVSLRTNPPLL